MRDTIAEVADLDAFEDAAWGSLDVAAAYWAAPFRGGHLSVRMKELILVAISASVTSLNHEAVRRHAHRAIKAGATHGEIIDVLLTIVALANHALYTTIPVLDDVLASRGQGIEIDEAADAEFEAAKQAFIEARGFWNPDREALARLIPSYYRALDALSTESWNGGPLTTKEREFICIGIDSTVAHTYIPGLRRHINNALDLGASAEEILEIFQLTGTFGLESYILGAKVLFSESEAESPDPALSGGLARAGIDSTDR
ncbi:carboxymuconolactone decarboxylase family protein [Microbacterium sp. F51-2R]|uniref:carboxymuconolactone decarboxylase family protein n=1 Tax=Microbacterium sp. F51-2R TaxID=3445777 RepID=UPI003F9F1FC6